ncbi:acetylornithine transaminase [Knoellia subterranea]|uniref:Acetylornithine aminotransferase n=1 Tax=Knoellia subterranea KCTC 19937 TaxID=1385521 RepID=A0A0A0JSB7_9MICO|nr:acetylornithine transaminase [Knoellia subterranea]KGN38962.1 acetylornithine aminotransferase [Knoellia subterranea KCTC 19937]
MTGTASSESQGDLLERYTRSLITVFGTPQLVLERGDGAWVWDTDGKRYLDLVGGVAVNSLGHNHPALVAAVSKQVAEMAHISNFYTSRAQIELAERILEIAQAPEGSGVFFGNSGAEAIEAAIKLARRTGRTGIVAAEGAFHGRTTGALALTHKAAYREPFAPLIPEVSHVPYNDIEALRAVVTEETSAVFLEPVQGEAGAIPADPAYLRAAREITAAVGALLFIDEVQTGIGRTGDWFGFQASGIVPDAITLAKGLGGGLPIGALVTFGPEVTGLLTAGQHGSTFGGNPLVAAAGLSVLTSIESDGLLRHVSDMGEHLATAVGSLGHSEIEGVRGRGLLRAIVLRSEISAAVAAAAREAGFLVNPVSPNAIRLIPPLVVSREELDLFIAALPGLIATAKESSS